MSILLQAYNCFILLVHYLIIPFLFSYITSVFLNIQYVSISDGHDNVCTCVVTIPHISYDLHWLHVFTSPLLIYTFWHTLSFCTRWTQLLYLLVSLHLLFPRMTIYVYDFFLTTFSSFFSILDLITYLLDSTSSIFPTYGINRKEDWADMYSDQDEEEMEDMRLDDEIDIHWRIFFEGGGGGVVDEKTNYVC